MTLNLATRHLITQIFVAMILTLIGTIYYFTEIKPFEYEGYENKINEFKKLDAELDKAIVQTQYGIIKNYDPIVNAINGLDGLLNDFKNTLSIKPNAQINEKIKILEEVTAYKAELVETFKELNPILINAIRSFSTNISQIIEDQSYDQLIESCVTMDTKFQSIEKARTLFTGMMIYTNVPDEATRLKLKKLTSDIKMEPDKIEKLDLALNYADVILDIKPELKTLNAKILAIPMEKHINNLYNTYKIAHENYGENADHYRITLYVMVFGLLVILRWAFKRLEKTIRKLNNEVVVRKKAEDELAVTNKELEHRVEDRTKELKEKNIDLNKVLDELRDTQDQLVLKEKMASVGMLTTGIAHEIKNPLNFINNFSDLSVGLLSELSEEIDDYQKNPTTSTSGLKDIIEDLKLNCQKINEHGKRADDIVKNMLLHSQEANSLREKVNLNTLIEENVKAAYELQKNKDKTINVNFKKTYDPQIGELLVIPQSIGRVVRYLIDNAIYTVHQRSKNNSSYEAKIKISTQKQNDHIEFKVWDNGEGIPENRLRKVFEPFFTSKPTGTGTGLGLSISYDTIVKQHNGEMNVISKEGEFTEFTIKLPLTKKPE